LNTKDIIESTDFTMILIKNCPILNTFNKNIKEYSINHIAEIFWNRCRRIVFVRLSALETNKGDSTRAYASLKAIWLEWHVVLASPCTWHMERTITQRFY